ncbi:mechanosensitive ion channel-like protein [Microterricola gilva]|uniref:Mechanosensitive ion channel-like protein n=1 Tax=Microterricola gilva TaxID=393267 RepID=A0A4V2GB40_9MICO|nr:mechanosensitive ion channel domain-containing protein [Microterricola gilva]RZU66696.1 mechanosensitive ion channel-like protein [Microterricola gilva]
MDGSALSDFFASGDITGWDLLLAALFGVAGWVVSIFVKRGVTALLARTPGVSPAVGLLIARIAKYIVILLGVGIGLSFLGASVQPFIAIAIIVGVILVLAMRGVADNFAAGVILQSRHPLKPGDEIDTGDYVGTVLELNGRSVVLRTADGRTIHVPNGQLLQEPLVNHSQAGARRSEVEVRVEAGRLDPGALGELLTATVAGVDGVHSREAAHTLIVGISPQRITTRVQYWHHPLHGVAVTSAVVLALAAACEENTLTASVTSAVPSPPLTTAELP